MEKGETTTKQSGTHSHSLKFLAFNFKRYIGDICTRQGSTYGVNRRRLRVPKCVIIISTWDSEWCVILYWPLIRFLSLDFPLSNSSHAWMMFNNSRRTRREPIRIFTVKITPRKTWCALIQNPEGLKGLIVPNFRPILFRMKIHVRLETSNAKSAHIVGGASAKRHRPNAKFLKFWMRPRWSSNSPNLQTGPRMYLTGIARQSQATSPRSIGWKHASPLHYPCLF